MVVYVCVYWLVHVWFVCCCCRKMIYGDKENLREERDDSVAVKVNLFKLGLSTPLYLFINITLILSFNYFNYHHCFFFLFLFLHFKKLHRTYLFLWGQLDCSKWFWILITWLRELFYLIYFSKFLFYICLGVLLGFVWTLADYLESNELSLI